MLAQNEWKFIVETCLELVILFPSFLLPNFLLFLLLSTYCPTFWSPVSDILFYPHFLGTASEEKWNKYVFRNLSCMCLNLLSCLYMLLLGCWTWAQVQGYLKDNCIWYVFGMINTHFKTGTSFPNKVWFVWYAPIFWSGLYQPFCIVYLSTWL